MTGSLRTNRWRGVVAVALVGGAVGIGVRRPSILVLAVLGVLFAAYPRVTPTPSVQLDLERRVSDPSPEPGDEVEVTVTLRNVGTSVLPDLRVVDGVPPALGIVDGSPRRGAVLRSGEAVTYSYSVEARHGRHRFEPATVVARDLSGARERRTTVSAETEIDTTAAAASTPPSLRTFEQVGRNRSDSSGSGVVFHSTREYRRGDATSRIDWRRYARQRELATVAFREEQAVTTVLLVDARENAYRAADGGQHAVAHSVTAAERLLLGLIGNRNRIGVAAFGRAECWLAPGTGRDHLARARDLFATHVAFDARPPDDEPSLESQADALRGRLSEDAHVLVLSPLTDDGIVDVVRKLDAYGYGVSVVSPDPTASDTVGRRLAGVERANRLSRLRRADISVVDWTPTTPLTGAIARSGGRWSG